MPYPNRTAELHAAMALPTDMKISALNDLLIREEHDLSTRKSAFTSCISMKAQKALFFSQHEFQAQASEPMDCCSP